MAKIALDMQSDGPKWQIAVEASMGGTNYTFRFWIEVHSTLTLNERWAVRTYGCGDFFS
jgi:hypothetical protein